MTHHHYCRPDARELLGHPFITRYNHTTNQMTEQVTMEPLGNVPTIILNCFRQNVIMIAISPSQIEYKFLPSPFTNLIRCSQLATPTMDHGYKPRPLPDHLTERPMRDVYYLWSLAGGELEAELTKGGIIQTCPPVTILPR